MTLFRVFFFTSLHRVAGCRCGDVHPRCLSLDRQSRVTSIFFLTSIFINSIQSSIAVFFLGPHIHEKWKGRIETWQLRKKLVQRKRRAPRKSKSSSSQIKRGRESVP